MKIIHKFRSLKKWHKWTIIGLLALIIYTLVGFFLVPAVAKKVAVDNLQETLSRQVNIERIRTNPFTLTCHIEGFLVERKDGKGPLISFRSLQVNAAWKSLVKFAPVVTNLKLDAPYINVTRNGDGSFNFSDLLKTNDQGESRKDKDDKKVEARPLRFSVGNIEISAGHVHFQDDVVKKTHQIKDMSMGIPFISTIGSETEIYVLPSFSADINGTPFSLEGKTKPFYQSRETAIDFELKGIDLPFYMEYFPAKLPISVPSGTLDLRTTISFLDRKDAPSELKVSGTVNLTSLTILDSRGRPLLELPRLAVGLSPSEVLKGDIRLGTISLDSPDIFLIREPSGNMNIHSMSPPADSESGEASEKATAPDTKIHVDEFRVSDAAVKYAMLKTPPGAIPQDIKASSEEILRIPAFNITDVTADIKNREVDLSEISTTGGSLLIKRLEDGPLNIETLAGPPAPPSEAMPKRSKSEDASQAWIVTLGKLSVKEYTVQAEDLVPETGAGILLDHIAVDAAKLSTQKNEKGTLKLNCRINKSGLLSLDGDVGLSPLQAGIKTGLKSFNLASIQPFASPYFPGLISQGAFYLSGLLSLKPGDKGSLDTLFKGDIGLYNFGSVDRRHSEDMIKFKSLKIKGLDLGTRPMHVSINNIGLDHLFAKVGIDSKGNVNLVKEPLNGAAASRAAGPDEGVTHPKEDKIDKTEDKVDKKASKPIPVRIGKVTLSEGHIQFSDKSLTTGYRTDLTNISGHVKGLSSKQDKEASLSLKGTLDRQARLEVTGRINPLAEELFVDVKVKFENMGLSSLSPYSGKYIGNKIAKGKLFIDLAYVVEKRKLRAKNLIYLDQFTLGEPVDSPDSTNLPVGLAISLLKDRKGKISLNVPIEGSLDEPEFSLGGLILQAFLNILTKAATAPFSLLSSAMGEEDASHLTFQFGSHLLTDQTKETLDKLVEILYDRPELALEVTGFVDRERDAKELTRYIFEKKLKARKLADIIKSGGKAIPVDDIHITKDEYNEYLQKAYKLETFEKPKNFLGFNKKLPPEEAEALILKHIEVTESDLEELAERRAKRVRDYIIKSEKVGAERIFLVEPASLEPEAVESVKNSRVDLGFRNE